MGAELVRGFGKFAVDLEYRLTLSHYQSGKVLIEMTPLVFIAKKIAILGYGILHD